ncbi:MAG: hypothetical protein ICV86_02465 [Microcoleus sp. T3-bin5]|nr:hypothetical protein [Microcoleus sp. T3-bin5]
MLSIVQVKRIKLDIPACNFNRNELEIAGERAYSERRFLLSPGAKAFWATDSLVVSGHFQYHASVLARRLNRPDRRTHPGDSVGGRKSSDSFGQTWETKTQSRLDTTASVQAQPTVRLKRGGVINKDACLQNNSNDDLESLIRSDSPDGHRCELIPVTITPLGGPA